MKRYGFIIHKWIGIFCCTFLFLIALTALALNHRDAFLYLSLHKQKAFSR